MNTDPNRKFSRSSALIGAYIAIAILTFLTSVSPVDAAPVPTEQNSITAEQPDAATVCKPVPWRYKYDNVIWTKLFPLAGYEISIDYTTKSNGCVVYNYWCDADVNWALGWDVTVHQKSCIVSRNAAGTVLTLGTNYTACLISKNLPVCYSGYVRRTINQWGNRIRTYGTFY